MKHKILVFLIFTVASLVLHFVKSHELFVFDADQEFYAFEYVKIVKEHHFTLIGIPSSFGGLNVGPLYTYLNALVYALFGGDPSGMNLVTLLVHSLFPGLSYLLVSKMTNERSGRIMGMLVLVSYVLWTKSFIPSPVNYLFPISLLAFYLLSLSKLTTRHLLILGVLLGVSLHIHLSLLFLFLVTVLSFLFRKDRNIRQSILLLLPIIFLFLSPLIIFDMRHDGVLTKNIGAFITAQETSDLSVLQNIVRVLQVTTDSLGNTVLPTIHPVIKILVVLLSLFYLIKDSGKRAHQIGVLFLLCSIPLLFFYKGPLPDYYFLFLAPIFLFSIANFLGSLTKNSYVILLILLGIGLINTLQMIQASNPYNTGLKKDAVNYIKGEVGDGPVEVYVNTDLGLQYGFKYLFTYYHLPLSSAPKHVYEIRLKQKDEQTGKLFRLQSADVGINVVQLK